MVVGSGNRARGEERSDSRYIPKEELTGFAKSLDVGVGKGRWKVMSRFFCSEDLEGWT